MEPSDGPQIDAELLLSAYASGIFPMADERTGEIGWYSPDPRGILPLDGLKVSRSLRQTMKKQKFSVVCDRAFETVMRRCAEREETWISEGLIRSYVRLHAMGCAHSVEAWQGDALVGESMFSIVSEASKICLVALVGRLRERHFELLDTQYLTPHLASLGAVEIPRDEYLERLRKAIGVPARFVN
jgi:leucyl/phenylalanyl-tRNA--protein transferase